MTAESLPSMAHPGLPRVMPALRWLGHLLEMLAVMVVGMTVLGDEAWAIAAALGLPDLDHRAPALAVVLMAAAMALPMALWMRWRGHADRMVVEMALAMLVPAAILVALGLPGGEGVYHPVMLAAMVGLMLVRREAYAGTGHRH